MYGPVKSLATVFTVAAPLLAAQSLSATAQTTALTTEQTQPSMAGIEQWLANVKENPRFGLAYADRYMPHIPQDRRAEAAENIIVAMRQEPWIALEYADRYMPHIPQDRLKRYCTKRIHRQSRGAGHNR